MTYFITENGSLLKKENGIWYIYSKNSSAPSPWHEIQTKPYRYSADYMDIKDFCDSVHSVDDSHYPYVKVIRHDMSSGTLELDNNEFVFFVKLEIDNSNLELLANDIKQRATYAEEARLRSLDFRIKRRLEDLEGQLNRGSDKSVRTYTRPPIVREPAKIDSYKKLIEHTNIELKRLKSPFTFFANDKIKAINTALLKLEELSASFTAGEEKLKQAVYKQLARESGLIDALNMHRFSWSSKAKSHAPTKAIENMASGLLKAI